MVARFRQGPRGIAFRDGKLYQFDADVVTVAATWPRVRAWRKTADQPSWRGCRPLRLDLGKAAAIVRRHERLLAAEQTLPPAPKEDLGWQLRLPFPTKEREWLRRRAEAWEPWLAPIPTVVRLAVGHFEERQFHALSLLARSPEATDLAHSNRVLAWAVATFWVFQGRRAPTDALRIASRLVRCRRREMCRALGFPATEATVRLLAKIRPAAVSVGRMLRLRAGLRDAAIAQLLGHLPAVTRNILAIVERRDVLLPHVTPTLMLELCGHRGDDRIGRVAWQLRQIVELHRLIHPDRHGPVFRTITRIREEHEECRSILTDGRFLEKLSFPSPPVPGTADIVPVATPAELVAEGRAQNNCVATYCVPAALRRVFIYRVLVPERATVAIAPHGGRWVISEIAAARNRPVKRETARAVARWLQQAQGMNESQPAGATVCAETLPEWDEDAVPF